MYLRRALTALVLAALWPSIKLFELWAAIAEQQRDHDEVALISNTANSP